MEKNKDNQDASPEWPLNLFSRGLFASLIKANHSTQTLEDIYTLQVIHPPNTSFPHEIQVSDGIWAVDIPYEGALTKDLTEVKKYDVIGIHLKAFYSKGEFQCLKYMDYELVLGDIGVQIGNPQELNSNGTLGGPLKIEHKKREGRGSQKSSQEESTLIEIEGRPRGKGEPVRKDELDLSFSSSDSSQKENLLEKRTSINKETFPVSKKKKLIEESYEKLKIIKRFN